MSCGLSFVICKVTRLVLLSTYFSVFRQYQDFLEDLEEDEALRKNVNIFRGEQLMTAAQTYSRSSITREISEPLFRFLLSGYGSFTVNGCLRF